MRFVDQHSFNARRSKFDAKHSFVKIYFIHLFDKFPSMPDRVSYRFHIYFDTI
jgi:hypothetical protein